MAAAAVIQRSVCIFLVVSRKQPSDPHDFCKSSWCETAPFIYIPDWKEFPSFPSDALLFMIIALSLNQSANCAFIHFDSLMGSFTVSVCPSFNFCIR